MTKHTPAPWTCHPNFSTSHIYHVYDENGCFFAADDIDCETQKANAALIAAAPDLMAALKGFAALDWDREQTAKGALKMLADNARAAIAKAEAA